MELSYAQKRILAITQKRFFNDSVCWLIYYLLTLGFFTLVLWNQSSKAGGAALQMSLSEWISETPNGDWKDAFLIILRDGLYYTLFMMMIVYLNLSVYKKILDAKAKTYIRYGGYLLVVVTSSIIFALILKLVGQYTDIIRTKINFPTNLLTVFCLSFISTGLLYLRQTHKKERAIKREKKRNAKLREKLEETSDKLEEMKLSISIDHIKVGSKNNYKIIPFDEIILFKGDGNEPRIYTTSGNEYIGSTSMSEYQSLLPENKFIRIHRSYIVNKEMVIGRKKNKFVLQGFDDLISIGDTYQEVINRDSRLGWETSSIRKTEVDLI